MLTAQVEKELLDESLANGLLHAALKKPWDSRELIEALRALAAPVS